MNCTQIEALLPRRLADALDESEARDVAAHVAACPACRVREESLRGALARFEALPRENPPPEVWNRVREAIDRELAAPPRRRPATWLWPAWGLATAAAVLVVLLVNPWSAQPSSTLVTGAVRIGDRPLSSGDSWPTGCVLETGPEGATLSAGTAWLGLGPATRVEVLSGDRVRLIEGEVEGRQIVVETAETAVPWPEARVARTAGFWTDVRLADVRRWVEFPGDREAPLAEYDAFIRDRTAAFKAGERLTRTPDSEARRAVAQIRREALHPRIQGALVEGLVLGALNLDARAAAAFQHELARSVNAGRSGRIPADWLLVESDELPAGPERETIRGLKLDLIGRLGNVLTRDQLRAFREIIEEDDDESDD